MGEHFPDIHKTTEGNQARGSTSSTTVKCNRAVVTQFKGSLYKPWSADVGGIEYLF